MTKQAPPISLKKELPCSHNSCLVEAVKGDIVEARRRAGFKNPLHGLNPRQYATAIVASRKGTICQKCRYLFCTPECLDAHVCPGSAPTSSVPHLRFKGRIEPEDLVCFSELVEVTHMIVHARFPISLQKTKGLLQCVA